MRKQSSIFKFGIPTLSILGGAILLVTYRQEKNDLMTVIAMVILLAGVLSLMFALKGK